MTASRQSEFGKARPAAPTGLAPEVLERLMPMHLVVAADGTIEQAGRTMTRLRAGLEGQSFFEVFDLRRPAGACSVPDLVAGEGRLRLGFRDFPRTAFKATAVPLPEGGGALVNLSFGISIVDAVRQYHLNAGDFAETDLAIEMLYLVEAKHAVMSDAERLTAQIYGAQQAAEERAATDALTGLRNRRALDDALQTLVDGGRPFAVLQMDLDHFKAVNDTHGHAAGDDVLLRVAAILSGQIRKGDIAARLGGDEFCLLLPGTVDPDRLSALGKTLIARIEEPIRAGGVTCHVSASIGVAVSQGTNADPASLLSRADAALYASKHAGRGRCTFAEGEG
ncbi:GGDEF domain-containing protein [Tropicimonas sp. IMCC34011]|uniref:GGDEF domain-containing protein n=1 Tax=Tropicimonas sp. IMCC34011 TaxID=2248759 RepID=UPI000E25286F|nr:GGDEF domain-containing protein [Tropicimonas sp. IMCC34011]